MITSLNWIEREKLPVLGGLKVVFLFSGLHLNNTPIHGGVCCGLEDLQPFQGPFQGFLRPPQSHACKDKVERRVGLGGERRGN